MNHAAIERGVSDVHKVEVPASWKDACACDEKKLVTTDRKDLEQYVNNVLNPVNAYQATSCRFPPLCLMWTAPLLRALPPLKSAVSR